MEKETYLGTQSIILQIGKAVNKLDLQGFLDQISKAEAAAPILDPTLFKKAQENMAAIKNLTKTLIPVKSASEEVLRAVLNTMAKGHMEGPPEMKTDENPSN